MVDAQLLVSVPALLGVGRAVQSALKEPSQALTSLFEGLQWDEAVVWKLDQENSLKLFNMVHNVYAETV